MNDVKEFIRDALRNNEIATESEEIVAKLGQFTAHVLEENEKYNLTAIKDPQKAALLHIADSLTVSALIDGGSVADIGAGAGFPSLPLAIYRPELNMTAFDATQKKVNFMNGSAGLFGLRNFTAVAGRAEELMQQGGTYRESFDTVTARAVAPLGILCELCAPAVRVGGKMIAMKGENAEEELRGAEKGAEKLGLRLSDVRKLTLRGNGDVFTRYLIVFDKISLSPGQYPRAFGQIKRKPLF